MKWNIEDRDRWDMYCRTWYGWGRLDAPWWVLGIEPGIDNSEIKSYGSIARALENRGRVWCDLGATETVDFVEFHKRIGVDKWERKLQPTWRKFLYVRDVANNGPSNGRRERLLSAQWGDRDVAFVDFWPVPNNRVDEWSGSALHGAPPYMKSRSNYELAIRDVRLGWVRKQMDRRGPGTVTIAAGAAIRPLLEAVVDVTAWNTPIRNRSTGRDRYRIVRLPSGGIVLAMSQGYVSNSHLDYVGRVLRDLNAL